MSLRDYHNITNRLNNLSECYHQLMLIKASMSNHCPQTYVSIFKIQSLITKGIYVIKADCICYEALFSIIECCVACIY